MCGTAAFAASAPSPTETKEQITVRAIPMAKVPPSIKAFQKTPTYKKRQATYAKTAVPPERKLTWKNEKTGLKITWVKNPSSTNGVTHIKKNKKTIGKTTQDPSHAGWVCSTQTITLTADSQSFLNNDYADTESHIYPGAIFTSDDLIYGTYKEQEGKRNPISLQTDNLNIKGSSYVTVNDPSRLTSRDAVLNLAHRLTGAPGNAGYSAQAYEAYNSASLNMEISGGGGGFGLNFSDAYSSGTSSSSVSLTIDARNTLFNISAVPSDKGFFVDQKIENNPYLIAISNVEYGVRVLANLTLTFNSSQEANEFKASYSGWGIDGNAALNFVNNHTDMSSKVNLYAIGGGSKAVTLSMDPKRLMNEVNRIMSSVTYENARPISYQYMDMAGDIMGITSLTDEFHVPVCGPATDNPRVTSILVAFHSGQDGKDGDTNLNMYVYPDNTPINNQNERDGAIYYYESRGHSRAYGAGQWTYETMTQFSPKLYTRNDFIKANGGHWRIHIYPNGNDTWWIDSVTLTFNFEDGTTAPYVSPNFVISQDVTTYDLYFPVSIFSP